MECLLGDSTNDHSIASHSSAAHASLPCELISVDQCHVTLSVVYIATWIRWVTDTEWRAQ